jgi:hypothetical protein
MYVVPRFVRKWVKRYLSTYTGVLNLEIIGQNIIECHLRLGEDTFALDEAFWRCLQSPHTCNDENEIHVDDDDKNRHQRKFFFPVFRSVDNKLSSLQQTKMRQESEQSCLQSDMHEYVVGNKQRQAMFTSHDFEKGRNLQQKLQSELPLSTLFLSLLILLLLGSISFLLRT